MSYLEQLQDEIQLYWVKYDQKPALVLFTPKDYYNINQEVGFTCVSQNSLDYSNTIFGIPYTIDGLSPSSYLLSPGYLVDEILRKTVQKSSYSHCK